MFSIIHSIVKSVILPRFLVDGVVITPPSAGPLPGVKYRGADSGLELTVIDQLDGPETGEFYIDFESTGEGLS